MNVKTKKLIPSAILPERAHRDDAGADLFAAEDAEIPPNSPAKVRTGIAIALPRSTAGIVWGKSSLESQGLIVTAGLIDEGYRGEVVVCLHNLTAAAIPIEKGRKIAQLLVIPVHYAAFEETDRLEESKRGTGGFGSTGGRRK